jgi:4-hydroxythreonine-4-phosphate dehydrogenase
VKKPLVLVTMGDPAGIGPEISARALSHQEVYDVCCPVLVGAREALIPYSTAINTISHPGQAISRPGILDVVEVPAPDIAAVRPGIISAAAGRIAEATVLKSIELCELGLADAVATAPINKEALSLARSPFIDHTAMYAKKTNSHAMTMFEVDSLRVFFLTRHVSLRESINMLSRELIVTESLAARRNMERLGFSSPRLALAALNPHGGEGGLFGTEETEVLAPAVADLRAQGVDVTGPVPADAVFSMALSGRFDAVLSLYHDQGHIATKTYSFDRTVSVTLGLPFIRTSVDHGTAMNIAGKGIASDVSLVMAIKSAARYAIPWATS